MNSQHITMTWEEFEQMPMKLGWKHEYWDGQAHISPRHQAVTVRISVKPRPVRSPCTIRPVAASGEPQLITTYVAAFSDTIDFCDWAPERIMAAAQDDMR